MACVSMWCNRMLVNGSTANFEHFQGASMGREVNTHFWLRGKKPNASLSDRMGEVLCVLVLILERIRLGGGFMRLKAER